MGVWVNHEHLTPNTLFVMYCPKCRQKMKEETRTFHKQRKWVCSKCGKIRMQKRKPDGA